MNRYARVKPWPARLILLFIAALITFGLTAPTKHVAAERGKPAGDQITDAELYRRTIAGVQAGGGYYPVLSDLLRRHNYPLKPFITFRQPLLTETIATIGVRQATGLLMLLGLATVVVWAIKLRRRWTPGPTVLATLLIGWIATALTAPTLVVWSEIWAGYFVALALGLREGNRWWPSVILLLIAALIREFALPVIGMMMLLAIIEGRRREALAYLTALAVAVTALAFHAFEASKYVLDSDLTSSGWSGMNGWRLFLTMMRLAGPLAGYAPAITAILIPLALLGWSNWRSPTGLRVTLTLGGLTVLFMIAARPDNFYWGMMIAPLFLAGLAFAPIALIELAQAARGPRLGGRETA